MKLVADGQLAVGCLKWLLFAFCGLNFPDAASARVPNHIATIISLPSLIAPAS